MRRIAIISTNEHPMYAWFVPLCALMWRDVAGFDLSCIFVGPVNPWFVERSREAGALIYQCETPLCCSTATASQLIRLFSYAAPGIDPGDYLLSVDSDAWPLARAFDPSGKRLDLIHPDACDHAETPYFPIGYLGMSAADWRGAVGIDAPSPESGLAELFHTDPRLTTGHTGWNYDETLITRRVKAQPWWPGEARILRRPGDPPVDRMDRSGWPANVVADGKIDAHLLRPGWTDENWPRLRPLLAQRLTAEHLAWADAYRHDSRNASGVL